MHLKSLQKPLKSGYSEEPTTKLPHAPCDRTIRRWKCVALKVSILLVTL
jgi:hypothetical protein